MYKDEHKLKWKTIKKTRKINLKKLSRNLFHVGCFSTGSSVLVFCHEISCSCFWRELFKSNYSVSLYFIRLPQLGTMRFLFLCIFCFCHYSFTFSIMLLQVSLLLPELIHFFSTNSMLQTFSTSHHFHTHAQ